MMLFTIEAKNSYSSPDCSGIPRFFGSEDTAESGRSRDLKTKTPAPSQ
jgi:hypothetical protein